MAQWIARRTSNPEAVGSSPTRGTYFNGIIQDNRTQHIVAQWIARRTSNPEAVGSSPTRGTYFNGIIQDNRTQHIGYTFKITYCARNHAALGHIILLINEMK